MIKQLTKLSRLHKNDLRNIKLLADRAAEFDGFRVKLYWHILQNRLTQELNDFFYYIDGNLVAYLGLFTFESGEAEITAVVHPKYRKQGIFRKLLAEVVLELKWRRIAQVVWVCPHRGVFNSDYMKALRAEYVFSQVEMLATRPPAAIENLPELKLRPATVADLSTLSKIGANCFNASYTQTLQRFTENMQEKNRKAWLASSEQKENVGKIHVRYDEGNKIGFIHDLCILPEYRSKGLASSMILQTMDIIRATGKYAIMLDVECHNQSALKLYQRCGFDTVAAYDFWKVPTVNIDFI